MTLHTAIKLCTDAPISEIIAQVSALTSIPQSEFLEQPDVDDLGKVRAGTEYATQFGRGWSARVTVTARPTPRETTPRPGGHGGRREVTVTFDTVYAYRDTARRNCNELHADYLLDLARWCESRGDTYRWCNEYTGQWHSTIEPDLESLRSA